MNYKLLFCLFIFPSYLTAQVEINLNDFNTSVGFEFERTFAPYVPPGSSGENQIWDFSDIPSGIVSNTELISPETTGLESEYPESNLVFNWDDGTVYRFYLIADTGISIVGNEEVGASSIHYNTPLPQIKFPANYENTFEENFSGTSEAGSTTSTFSGTLNVTCDGYGTLNLPWGSFSNVLRVRHDNIINESFQTTGGSFEVETTGSAYFYYAIGFPGPLVFIRDLSVENLTTGETFQNQLTVYISDINLSTENADLAEDILIFPNPASETLNVQFTAKTNNQIQIELIDIQGRIVHSVPSSASGIHSYQIEIPVDNLPNGAYVLRLRTDKTTQQQIVVIGN